MPTTTLLDGRVVDTASEDHRHECEARWILNLPRKHDRLDYLELVGKRRGPAAVTRLEKSIIALWKRQGQGQLTLA
jgi:hypothetical protein